MGVCGTRHAAERDYLVVELKSLITVLDIKSFNEFETSLKSSLYHENTFHGPLRKIWTEITS
jgi:hypothetical protein